MSNQTRVFGSALLVAALCLLGASTAGAHATRTGLYVEGGGGFEYFSIASVEGIINPMIDDVGNTDGTFWAESYFLTFGFQDGEGTTLPDPLGRDARVELSVRYTDGDSDQGVDTNFALGFLPISNPVTANGSSSGPPPNTAFYETNLRKWDVDLLYETDVPFNDALVFTPFAGVTWSWIELDNDFTIFEAGIDFSDAFSLEDDTDAHFGGIVLGGDATLTLLERLTLRAGVRVDLMAVTAQLDAEQNFTFGPPGLVPPTRVAETDRDLDFAARVGAGLGAGIKLGMFELGIDGTARYHSYMPKAEHPTRHFDRTSRIEGRSAWSASVLARLTIHFGPLVQE
jgi:hypothetical protein